MFRISLLTCSVSCDSVVLGAEGRPVNQTQSGTGRSLPDSKGGRGSNGCGAHARRLP